VPNECDNVLTRHVKVRFVELIPNHSSWWGTGSFVLDSWYDNQPFINFTFGVKNG